MNIKSGDRVHICADDRVRPCDCNADDLSSEVVHMTVAFPLPGEIKADQKALDEMIVWAGRLCECPLSPTEAQCCKPCGARIMLRSLGVIPDLSVAEVSRNIIAYRTRLGLTI